MRMYDCIKKKRNGEILSKQEIQEMVEGYTSGKIPDYQMSAMLMAIYFQGMTPKETADLTLAMAYSGEIVDLSSINGIKVDKHSTGGVGDKTTLIAAPIAAACGVKVAKMSGRGLGHTGGTIDKLESIPGFRVSLSRNEFLDAVNQVGLSVIGQSERLAPADKRLYALRDVTATIESIPLIASSIMSKKLASGSDCILLDVKTGSGAFMNTLEEAIQLAKEMVSIGEHTGKRTIAHITNMDIPLGMAIGNSLEVIEAAETLLRTGSKELAQVCLNLASDMIQLAYPELGEESKKQAIWALQSGKAFEKLVDMVERQGGDSTFLKNTEKFPKAPIQKEIHAWKDGYITKIQAEKCGIASSMLGAGRETKESVIDYSAGILLKKKYGETVNKGEILCTMYTSNERNLKQAEEVLYEAYEIKEEKPVEKPLIYGRVDKDGWKQSCDNIE